MKKTLLGAAAAIAVVGVAFSGSANAACYWNGYSWNCASPQVYYQPHPYQYGYQPYYGYSQPDSYGSYSYWNPSRYPGPRASGHGGYSSPLTQLPAPLPFARGQRGRVFALSQRFKDFPC